MDIKKVEQVIALQIRVNEQIECYGEADHDTVDEMIKLADSLTPEEEDAVLNLYYQVDSF
jgi:hypothetical protein